MRRPGPARPHNCLVDGGPIFNRPSPCEGPQERWSVDVTEALFSYHHLYVGLTPHNAPGVFSLLAATELTDGVWYAVDRV